MGVFDLSGPEFLGFFAAAVAAAVVAGLITRAVLRMAAGSAVPPRYAPDPYDVAYLKGGPPAVAGAALAALVQAGAAKVSASGGMIVAVGGPVPKTLGAPAAEAHRALSDGRYKPRQVAAGMDGPLAAIERKLRSLQLAPTAGQAVAMRLVPVVPLILVLAVGVAKLTIGVARQRAVGFLGTMLIVAAVLVLSFVLRRPRVTSAGARVLRAVASSQAALRQTARSRGGSLTPTDAAMAMALFGPTVFAAGPLADFGRVVTPYDVGGGSAGYTSGSSSSDGGGSSCSGGGGGGGGGCGGCGGGGGGD